MEFGKLAQNELDFVDFTLPPDDPRTWETLAKSKSETLPRLAIGAPLWSVKDWVGLLYPRGTESKDYLHHYSRQFNTIELNTTHYRTPDQDTVKRWRDETPDTFKFCPKILQEISHRSPLDGREALVKEFVSSLMGLEDKLGVSFLQLPPNFTIQEGLELKRFLEKLPKGFEIAIEARHPSFFDGHQLNSRYFDLLARFGAHVVITDVAGRRDVLHFSLPTPKVLVRFVCNDLHASDHKRVQDWVERVKTWIHLGLNDLEFFVHQPTDKNVPQIAAEFVDAINNSDLCNGNLKMPRWQPMNQGEQLGFF